MSYWKNARNEAWHATLLTFGLQSREQTIIKLFLVLVAFMALYVWGLEGSLAEEAIVQGLVVLSVVSIFPLIFVKNLLAIPAKLDDKKNIQIKDLNEKIEKLSEVNAKIDVKILEMNIGDAGENQGFALMVQVTNKGDKVSSLPFWGACIERHDGSRRNLFILKPALTKMNSKDGIEMTLKTEDQMYFKCREPLSPGNFFNGALICVDPSGERLKVGEKIIAVGKDIFDNIHEAVHINRGENSAPMYHPGIESGITKYDGQ